jgi:choice-of-anchor A domain-containing protein
VKRSLFLESLFCKLLLILFLMQVPTSVFAQVSFPLSSNSCAGIYLSDAVAINLPLQYYKPFTCFGTDFNSRDNALNLAVGGDLVILNGAAEIEGRTFVMGNLNMNKSQGVFGLGAVGAGGNNVPDDGANSITIGGNLNAATTSAAYILGAQASPANRSYGTLVYKGTKSSTVKFNLGTDYSKIIQQPTLDLEPYRLAFDNLKKASSYWKTLPDKEVLFSKSGDFTIKCQTPGTAKLYVININQDLDFGTYQANLNFVGFSPESTLLINVLGPVRKLNIAQVLIDGVQQGLGATATDVLEPLALNIVWNFPDATSLILKGGAHFVGSIVAPQSIANVTNSMPSLKGRIAVGGTLILSGTGGSEIHCYPFRGGKLLPCDANWFPSNELVFDYDPAGNQQKRYLCINCKTPSQLTTAKTPQNFSEVPAAEFIESEFSSALSYYPNPVKEELYVQWHFVPSQTIESFRVYDLSGRLLTSYREPEGNTTETISFGSYPSGVYLLEVSYTSGDQKTIQIIKQ